MQGSGHLIEMTSCVLHRLIVEMSSYILTTLMPDCHSIGKRDETRMREVRKIYLDLYPDIPLDKAKEKCNKD